MARDVVVGIVIAARDQASDAMRKVGNTAKKVFDQDVAVAGDKGKKALDAIEKTINSVAGAMQIAEKVGRALASAVQMTVGAALAQRAEGDAQRQTMERLGTQFQRIAGLVGDVFVPIILGVADALKPTIDGTERWLSANKRLVGGGVVEFLQTTSNLLVAGVAAALVLVSRGWTFLNLAISSMMSVGAQAFAGILSGLSSMMGGASAAARAMGRGGLADAIDGARGAIDDLRSSSSGFAAEADRDIQDQLDKQTQFEAQVNRTANAIATGIGVAAVRATQRLDQEVKKIPPDYDKIREAAEKAAAKAKEHALATADALALSARKRTDMWTREAAATQRNAELQQSIQDAEDARLDQLSQANADAARESAQSWASAAMSIQSVMISAFSDIDGRAKTVGDAIKQMFSGLIMLALQKAEEYAIAKAIEMAADEAAATTAIGANAATAASGQIAAHSSIPFVGIAIGAAAAATIFALAMGYAGKFHTGGTIPGMPGEERMAILKAGELVVSADRAPAARAAGFGPLGSAGARATPTAGGGVGTLGVTVRTVLPADVEIDNLNQRPMRRSMDRVRRLGGA